VGGSADLARDAAIYLIRSERPRPDRRRLGRDDVFRQHLKAIPKKVPITISSSTHCHSITPAGPSREAALGCKVVAHRHWMPVS